MNELHKKKLSGTLKKYILRVIEKHFKIQYYSILFNVTKLAYYYFHNIEQLLNATRRVSQPYYLSSLSSLFCGGELYFL